MRMYLPYDFVCDFLKAVTGSIPLLTRLRQTLNLSFGHLSAKQLPTCLLAAVRRQLWFEDVLFLISKTSDVI